MDLSIVIPVHNEENRLPECMRLVSDFLLFSGWSVEIILVENGSQDRTWEYCQFYSQLFQQVRALQIPGRGKGAAVRAGMLAAQGAWRYMADVDLSTPLSDLVCEFMPRRGWGDVLIGSREIQGARRIGEPAYRHWMGRGFNWLVRRLARLKLADTQCGFKMFSARAAQDLFSRSVLSGMSFDVEILYLAQQLGYRMIEIPVSWSYNGDSRVRLVEDSLRMAGDILEVRRRWQAGQYEINYQPVHSV